MNTENTAKVAAGATNTPTPTETAGSAPVSGAGAPRRQGFGGPSRGPRGAGGGRGGPRGSRGGMRGGRGNMRGPMRPSRPPEATQVHKQVEDTIPPLAADSIRIIPLGGVEEIGKNMTAIEFGNDIVVIDIGFQFKDENTPGIDYILPNTKYLEERREKVRAVIITHGHLDHIGGIPYVMPRIGNPPLYTRMLTSVMIKSDRRNFLMKSRLILKSSKKTRVSHLVDLK